MNKEICAYLVFCLNLVNSVITGRHLRLQFLRCMSYLGLKKVNKHSDIFVYVLQNYLNINPMILNEQWGPWSNTAVCNQHISLLPYCHWDLSPPLPLFVHYLPPLQGQLIRSLASICSKGQRLLDHWGPWCQVGSVHLAPAGNNESIRTYVHGHSSPLSIQWVKRLESFGGTKESIHVFLCPLLHIFLTFV